MSVYLTCGLCGRKQADGLLSRGAWGHLDAGVGRKLQACPTCKAESGDWQTRLLAASGPAGATQPS